MRAAGSVFVPHLALNVRLYIERSSVERNLSASYCAGKKAA